MIHQNLKKEAANMIGKEQNEKWHKTYSSQKVKRVNNN